MDLTTKYHVTCQPAKEFREVTISIPNAEVLAITHSKHDINLIFNQVMLFAAAMKATNCDQTIIQALDKIVADFNSISRQICWVKGITKAIKETE